MEKRESQSSQEKDKKNNMKIKKTDELSNENKKKMSIPISESIHTFNRNEIQEKAFRFNLSLSIHPESPPSAHWYVHIAIGILQGREST